MELFTDQGTILIMASKSYFTEQVTGLYNGVSTLPEDMRRENQAEEQINFVSDISRGLESRNGTEYIAALDFATNVDTNSYITKIDKDTRQIQDVTGKAQSFTDDYILAFTGANDNTLGAVEIYDKNGVQQQVLNPNNAYLHTSNPQKDIRTALIEDYLVVSNASINTAMTSDVSPDDDNSKLVIFIKQLQPSATYQIFLGSDKVAEVTLNNVNNPETLLNGLESDINNGGIGLTTISGTYTAEVAHGNLVITKDDGSSIRDDDFTVVDTYGDTLLGILNGSITKASDLPPSAPNGTIAHVVGVDEQNTLADYYLKYHSSENVWKETVAPGIKTTLDPATMPHFIIKTSTNNGIASFQIVEAGDTGLSNQRSASGFTDRLVGDEDSNPIPSFVGGPIIDLLFYRNRLMYLGKDSLVMSGSNDYFNLFNDSAIRALGSDPIDIFLGTNYSVRAKYVEPYQTGAIVFCEDQQFAVHSSDQALTPSTVRLEQITQYQTNEDVHPLSLGDHIVFAGSKGNNAVIRRFSTKSGNLIKDAFEMTTHVDTYIPKDLRFMFGISNKNMLFLAPRNDLKTLYVYNSYQQNNQLVQESWSKFTFNFDVIGAVTFNNEIYFIDKSGRNNSLSKLDLFDHSLELQVDQYSASQGEDTAADGSSQFLLPYRVEDDDSLIAVSLINNKVADIHPTVRTEVSYPDSTLAEYAYSSKAKVPGLLPYVPDDIEVQDSYIEAYNGDYKFLSTDNNEFKSYYLLSDNQKRNIINYNSETGKYEIKGFGDDINFPDFVADYSPPPDPKILPAKNLTTEVDENNWKINLNKNGTGEERDTFGIFRGLGRGQLASNYVYLAGNNTLNTDNDWEINASIYFDSSTKPNSPIFTTVDSVAATKPDNYVNLYRVDSTKTAQLQMSLGGVLYNYYIDNLFTDEWHELRINFYYGLLFVYDYNIKLNIYDSPFGVRNKVDRVPLITANLETQDLNLMKDHSFSPTSIGYYSDFKISDVTRNHSLEFKANNNAPPGPYYFALYKAPTAVENENVGFDRQRRSFVGYFKNTTSLNPTFDEVFLSNIQFYETYTYVELSMFNGRFTIKKFKITPGQPTLDSVYIWAFVDEDSGDIEQWIYAGNFDTTPPALGWRNDPIPNYTTNLTGLPSAYDHSLELPEHTLGDHFRFTMLADFEAVNADDVYYSNQTDAQGLFNTGTFSFGRHGTSGTGKLGFLPKDSTNHQPLQVGNPHASKPLITHNEINKQLTNFTVHETEPVYRPIVTSSDIFFVPELDPTLTISSKGGNIKDNEVAVKYGVKMTTTDTTPDGVYIFQGTDLEAIDQEWIISDPKSGSTYKLKKLLSNIGNNQEAIVWFITETPSGGSEATIFRAKWDRFTTFTDEDTGEVETVENGVYPVSYKEIDFLTPNCTITTDTLNLGVELIDNFLEQHTVITFSNTEEKYIYDIEMSDGVTAFPLEGQDSTNMPSVVSRDAVTNEGYVQVSGQFNTYSNNQIFYHEFIGLPYFYAPKTFIVNWGDGETDQVTASNPATHSYTSAVPTVNRYTDGTEYFYFSGLGTTYDGYDKIEIEYNNGEVSVKINDVSKTLYANSNLTSPKSSLTNTFNGFGVTSINSVWGKITKADVTDSDFLDNGVLPPFSSEGSSSKLKYLKLDHINNNDFTNVFEYRFETSPTSTQPLVVLDENNPINNAALYIITDNANKPIWTTTSATFDDKLHYEFNDRTEEEAGAKVDSEGSIVGSKVTDSSGNNLHGTMKINDVQSYLSCWAVPPNISYYDRIMKFGYPTENLYTLSRYYLKRNGEPVSTGRLNLKALEVSFAEAVNFELEITPEERNAYTKQFASGVGQTTSDTINVVKGTHKFGLNALAEYLTLTLKNNSPFRSRFTSLGYEGSFINRSKIR